MDAGDAFKKSGKPYVWCLVGNVVEERYYGAGKEIRSGTRKFRPNAKVYCYPALWGDGYEGWRL